MVSVSETDERSAPDLNVVVHRTVHHLLEREKERPGWYGDPLDTAWVGLALQQHEGYRDRLSKVADELEQWFRDTEIYHEFEVAALGLIGKFFRDYERGRPIYTDIEEQLFSELEEEHEKREAFRDVHSDPQFQFFASHIYLYCAPVGIEAYERLDQYQSFLYEEVESHRKKRWTEYERMAFVETVALRVKQYEARECRSVLKEMRKVDLKELREDEIIPLTWFFQEQQEPILDKLRGDTLAQQFVDEIRQNLWQRLYDELPFQLYLSGEIEYKFSPNVRQLAQLDQLLGRLENSIRVFSERQLEKHDDAVVEEKNKQVRVNRLRGRIGFVVSSFLLGFVAADIIIAQSPTLDSIGAQRGVQTITAILMMVLEWQLEGASRDYGIADTYEVVGDYVKTVEEGNWPAWILRAVFGLIAWFSVGYGWKEIQAFFQSF